MKAESSVKAGRLSQATTPAFYVAPITNTSLCAGFDETLMEVPNGLA